MTRFVLAISDNPIEGFKETLISAHSMLRGDEIEIIQGDGFEIFLKKDNRANDSRVAKIGNVLFVEFGLNFSNLSDEEKVEACLSGDSMKISRAIDGDACIILIDSNSQQVIIVSDHWGLRPLYYHSGNSIDVIASDQRGILAILPEQRKRISKQSVEEYLASHIIFNDRTLFEEIKLFPDGAIGQRSIKPNQEWNFRRWYYWPLEFLEVPFKQSVTECGEIFKNMMSKRILPGTHLLLSGGMDSRGLLAMAPPESRKDITAVNFGVEGFPEHLFSRATAKRYGIDFNFYPISPSDIIPNAFAHMWASEGISNHIVALVRHVVKQLDAPFVLEGFGGDAQLGASFHGDYLRMKNNDWPGPVPDFLLDVLLGKGLVIDLSDVGQVLGTSPSHLRKNLTSSIKSDLRIYPSDMLPIILAETFMVRSRVRRYTIGGPLSVEAESHCLKPYYTGDFMHRVMAVPAEDRRKHKLFIGILKKYSPKALMDASTRTAPKSVLLGAYSKFIKPTPFRKVAHKAGTLIASRTGIETRQRDIWITPDRMLRKSPEYQKWVLDILLSPRAQSRGILDINRIEEMVKEHLRGSEDWSQILLNAIDLEMTMQLYSDGKGFEMFGTK